MSSTDRADPPSTRPTYTPWQLHRVWDRIDFPSRFRYEPGEFSKEVVRHHDGHGFLSALMTHSLAYIPFENLELHYSPHHQISIHPDALFEKIVRQNTGRGGYPLENNVFLGTVLRSFGFEVMSVGARLNTLYESNGESNGEHRFAGWSHMVNLVTIRGETFLVDVGFGSGGPTQPIPLVENEETVIESTQERMRLRRDAIAENEYQGNKLWILERQVFADGHWTALYCFEDFVCFLPQDFEVMHFHASTHRTSFFTYRVIVMKYLLDARGESVVGELILRGDRVLRQTKNKLEVLAMLYTEEDRVESLEKYFNITLTQAQAAGIRGMVTELPSRHSDQIIAGKDEPEGVMLDGVTA
ncbi:hypothetical protein BAUCODRAFT_74506 [Baudoinia panamericana UAMH 10762]|uniref:Uncharacterized protein n=1 Tax=Baudoinia panamericana (strain UAMH 10762) TaxID=717646 RepID=M2LHZ9_BAUPA|nr:uncharacterized protein BAUCODRAFT_74506 [Baudoinia panamericana UAMH 10762]EMC93807.1 hypothetical protein BAUCODRAFT_74506 [Baudoinia panamericana UAMH 10762]